jgi:hypothetical protein
VGFAIRQGPEALNANMDKRMQETRKGKRQLLIDGTNLTKTNLPLNLTMPKKSSYKQSHLASA